MSSLFNSAVNSMINSSSLVQAGGAAAARSNYGVALTFFIAALIVLALRALIVQYSYNMMVPKLVATLSENPEKTLPNFRQIGYMDALMLVLLVSCLVSA